MMLDMKLRAELDDHSVIKICIIIRNDSFWDTVPTDEVVYDESGHHVLVNRRK